MEWQGIDLSGNTQSKWVFTHYTVLKNTLLSLIFMSLISMFITFYFLQKKQEIRPLVAKLNQLQGEITSFENKITHLNNNAETVLPTASKEEIEKYLILIQALPLKNGGINSIQIYLEPQLHLKLNGKLQNQTDFKQLEKYLNSQDFIEIKTDQISVNHKNEIEFIFTLKYKE